MTEHLGHDKHEAVTNAADNARNGYSGKTLKGDFGELSLAIPRDRNGVFEPQLVGGEDCLFIDRNPTARVGISIDEQISTYLLSISEPSSPEEATKYH